MPALDLIRPSVTAMRVIASVNAEFARELKLPPHIRSLGLISADSDDNAPVISAVLPVSLPILMLSLLIQSVTLHSL